MSGSQGELEGLRSEHHSIAHPRKRLPWHLEVTFSNQVPLEDAPFSGLEIRRFRPGETKKEKLKITYENDVLRLHTEDGEEIKDANFILAVASQIDNQLGTKLVQTGNLERSALKYKERAKEINARRKRAAA